MKDIARKIAKTRTNLRNSLFVWLAAHSKNNHRDKNNVRAQKGKKPYFFEVFEKIKALNLSLHFEIKRGRKTASFTPM
ncbi:hypothetical protein [Methylophaga sp.]|uniref:hypothetical protein n=1 Tax=Methylophaga sp. TaxID=2024840 RepID=UPI00271B4DE0|nr:hypothetical protein [Methylophaga sp.]MDO8827631.1 hypothetical protein [Methylophaga sp.]